MLIILLILFTIPHGLSIYFFYINTMIHYFTTFTIISLIGLSYYKGYYSKSKNWLDVKCNKIKMLMKLMNNIQQVSSSAPKPSSFCINPFDTSATIFYQRLGSQYKLLIPYNMSYISYMSQFKVELLLSNSDPQNITQQPGIPYLICAKDLGGSFIRITNEDTGLFHDYPDNIIPMYGEEVFDRE